MIFILVFQSATLSVYLLNKINFKMHIFVRDVGVLYLTSSLISTCFTQNLFSTYTFQTMHSIMPRPGHMHDGRSIHVPLNLSK